MALEELIELALVILTLLFYLFRVFQKPSSEETPIPQSPEEIWQELPSPEKPQKITLKQEKTLEKSYSPAPQKILNQEKSSQSHFLAESQEKEGGLALDFLEKNFTLEERLVIYAEIMKRPEF